MKRLLAVLVCSVFILSIAGAAEAQFFARTKDQLFATSPAFKNLDPDKRSKLSQLNIAELRNLERRLNSLPPSQVDTIAGSLNIEQLRRINKLSPAAISSLATDAASAGSRVDMLKDVRIQATKSSIRDAYIKRPVALTDLVPVEQRFTTAKENYASATEAFKSRRIQIRDARSDYVLCKNSDTAECEEKRNVYIGHVKNWLLDVIDGLIERTKMHLERVNENTDTDEELINEMATEMEQMITGLEDLRSRVEVAETREELRDLLSEMREWLKNNSHKTRFNLVRLLWNHMKVMNMKINRLTTFAGNAISRLESNGFDTSEVQSKLDEFQAKLDEVRDKIGEAKDLFTQAKELKETATDAASLSEDQSNEIRNLVKQAREKLSEARTLFSDAMDMFKDAVKDIRTLLKDELGVSVKHTILLDPEASSEDLPEAVSDVEDGEVVITELEGLE